MDAPSDEELAEVSLDGDREAYARLVHRHRRHVFAVCLGLVGTLEDVEDLSQETFVKGFSELSRLRERGRFRVYLRGRSP